LIGDSSIKFYKKYKNFMWLVVTERFKYISLL
jgi:hypothetical protein